MGKNPLDVRDTPNGKGCEELVLEVERGDGRGGGTQPFDRIE